MKAKNYLIVLFLCFFTTASAFASFEVKKEQEPQRTAIELLQNGESYSIEITSVSCFNGSRETVIVSKEAERFHVNFQDFSKILTEPDIQAFISFELQLHALQRGGCSTVDTYVIRYGDETFRTSDGTCSWNGGKKLLKAIS